MSIRSEITPDTYVMVSQSHFQSDSQASDHIFGNKDLFSSLTYSSPLLTITLANGSQTIAKGIKALAQLVPSLPYPLPLYFMFLIFVLILFPLVS